MGPVGSSYVGAGLRRTWGDSRDQRYTSQLWTTPRRKRGCPACLINPGTSSTNNQADTKNIAQGGIIVFGTTRSPWAEYELSV
jgi:hypothetical protein